MKRVYEESKALNKSTIETRNYAQAIVDTLREPVLIINNDLRLVTASDKFYSSFGLTEEKAASKIIYELEDRQWDVPALRNLLESVLPEKKRILNFKIDYDFKFIGTRTFLINATHLEREEEDKLILLSFKEITENQDQKKNYLKSFRDILAHAPAMICTLKGREHIFELANENYLKLVGNRKIIGKAVREALPEVENQGFIEILDQVFTTGEPFIGHELPVKLDVGEQRPKNCYLDFLYQPTWNSEGNIDGIFVHAIDVTEKVETRKRIEESEIQLRDLINTVPAIIWISDKKGGNKFLNKNWYEIVGEIDEKGAGFGWMNLIHPDDREKVETVFREAIKEQQAFKVVFRFRFKDGNYRWVVDRGSPKYDAEGAFDGMIGTVVDVHEEEIKEKLIREKEHRIRTIVEEATVATAVYIGKDNRIDLANETMMQLWGKDRSVIGKNLSEALPELEGQPFFELLRDVYTTGETYWGKEDRVDLMIDNRLQKGYFNFTYKPLRDENGQIYGILNMALDVTETVNSKELLKERESYFHQMADLMPGKVANTDPEGNFIYFNNNWLDYTGWSSEELEAKGWTHFIHPEEEEKFHKYWQESLRTGENFEMEIRCQDKNGDYKWQLNRAEAVRDELGKIKMWIGTTTEVERLKEEEKRKGDFLKMVSHELKTPITSIKGYVQLLLSLLKKEEQVDFSSLPLKPSLERIDHQLVRLTRLIAEMLDLSRIEENQLELKKENFNLNELVDETVQDINYTNTQHKINVSHEFACKVLADKDRIGQVLINFITNAIKYSPESQQIEIKVQKSGSDKVKVSVRDKGIGIDFNDQKNIFKRFHRIGVKGKETYAGFGIGLYLANEIIQRHNGAIEVESERGEGSVFSFSLSVAQ